MRGVFAKAYIEENYFKKIKMKALQKIFKFGNWQLSIIEERPYALEVVRGCNRLLAGIEKPIIVEVGAGTGEIISNIAYKKGKKFAYDINAKNIRAGKIMHPELKYHLGTFEDVNIGTINCFIMVNFIHALSNEILQDQMREVLVENDVSLFVIDTFSNNENTCYTYSHDGKKLFGAKYYLHHKSKGFATTNSARRYIEYWVKKLD